MKKLIGGGEIEGELFEKLGCLALINSILRSSSSINQLG
jgi:hypothetical protein